MAVVPKVLLLSSHATNPSGIAHVSYIRLSRTQGTGIKDNYES